MTETTDHTEPVGESQLMKVVDWAYDKGISGGVGFDSAEKLAADYQGKYGSPYEAANALIRWQNTKAATSGFVTSLGGLLTLPVTVPLNISSVLFVQLRMIAAIAHMGGLDVRDDRVRTLCYVCLCGSSAVDILKQVGIQASTQLTRAALTKLSGATLLRINQAVGFRLVTKFGSKGVINLHKAIPVVGGIIGATVDAVATNIVGNAARDTLIGTEEHLGSDT